MRTIAIMNNKGGVGKTVTAINVADILVREYGQRVVLVDCDGQRNLTDFFAPFGYDEETCYSTASLLLGDGEPVWSDNLLPISPGLDLVPASTDLYNLDFESIRSGAHDPLRMRSFVQAAREDHETDFFLLDCPPGFTVASVGALLAADEVIVPLTVDGFSLRGLETMGKQLNSIHRGGALRSRVLITRWNRSRAVREGETLLRSSGIQVFDAMIPNAVCIAGSTLQNPGEPLSVFAPRSKAYAAYQALTRELMGGGAHGL